MWQHTLYRNIENKHLNTEETVILSTETFLRAQYGHTWEIMNLSVQCHSNILFLITLVLQWNWWFMKLMIGDYP